MSITLTGAAKEYFNDLIQTKIKQLKSPLLNIKVTAIAAGTPDAKVDLMFCPKGEELATDIAIDCNKFIFYVASESELAFKDAIIDYKENKLSIKAPNLKVGANLFNAIESFIMTTINPMLASHRGMVKLVAVNEDSGEVALQFGGGCKGCSMVDFTLKHSIEKSLKNKFPEIQSIKDITDHKECADAYYK